MSADNSEFAFIEWARARAAQDERLTVPIGDDTACWDFPEPARCLITTDMLLEGTHFTIPPATPCLVGRKALAVNLSDVAAMAGRPLAAFISIAFPRHGDGLGEELYAGLQELAGEFGVVIAGGDTNAWDGPLAISLTLLGEATSRGPVTRGGAQPGDAILVTGELGGSLSGRHLEFAPRVREALRLHEAAPLHAMIDLSDGLASDLPHILDESRVGAELDADAIPVSESARMLNDGRAPLEHALSDGEDFELLFTVSPQDGDRLLDNPPLSIPLTRIGTIIAERKCELVDAAGNRSPLEPTGWQHRW